MFRIQCITWLSREPVVLERPASGCKYGAGLDPAPYEAARVIYERATGIRRDVRMDL